MHPYRSTTFLRAILILRPNEPKRTQTGVRNRPQSQVQKLSRGNQGLSRPQLNTVFVLYVVPVWSGFVNWTEGWSIFFSYACFQMWFL